MPIAAVVAGQLIDPTTFGNAVADWINNIKAAEVATAEATASVAYVDLATVGPSVTCKTRATALVFISSLANQATTGNSGFVGVAVSGATTIAAADAKAIWHYDPSNANSETMSGLVLITGLTPGNNTFTLKYKANAATAVTFSNRVIAVLPLA